MIVIATVLAAFVFYAQTISSDVLINEPQGMEGQSTEIEQYINLQKSMLGEAQKKEADQLEASFHGNSKDTSGAVKLAQWWDSAGVPIAAAYYYHKTAEAAKTSQAWQRAGEAYQQAYSPRDSVWRTELMNRSIEAYQNALNIDGGNLDARAGLAVTFLESGRPPMEAVGMLKTNLEADPEHESSLFYMGVFSMQSGQYQKAVERFEHLVSLHPEKPLNYFYLAQSYIALHEEEKAINALEKFKERVETPAMKEQAQQLIDKLENNKK